MPPSPPNNPGTILHRVFEIQNWKVKVVFAVVFNGKLCPLASKVSDIYKFTGPERLHLVVLREPATVDARTPPATFEIPQSQKEVWTDEKNEK